MNFVVVGCSYRTAPVDLRERLAFDEGEAASALTELSARPEIAECLIVSTCNRVELYAVSPDAVRAERALERFMSEAGGVSAAELEPALYRRVGEDALAHIFRVASSLDAMVVGEAQIAGQVKDAFALAQRARAVGPLLSRCMQRAFAVAKRVRTDTGIARHPASVSSVAVDLAGRIFADLGDIAVLIVGAGEMAELAGRHLVAGGARRLRVTSRTIEHANKVASELSADTAPFSSLTTQLEWADVVITSTGSKTPIISDRDIARVMRRRKQKPLFIVDIAVPRDVEGAAGHRSNVYLFGLDDLEQVVAENLKARRREAGAGERMVVEEVAAFSARLREGNAVPVVRQLRERFTAVARGEAERTARKLGLSGPDQQEAIQRMADAIANKLLHAPTVELKRVAGADPDDLVGATRRLFDLHEKGAGAIEPDASRDVHPARATPKPEGDPA